MVISLEAERTETKSEEDTGPNILQWDSAKVTRIVRFGGVITESPEMVFRDPVFLSLKLNHIFLRGSNTLAQTKTLRICMIPELSLFVYNELDHLKRLKGIII